VAQEICHLILRPARTLTLQLTDGGPIGLKQMPDRAQEGRTEFTRTPSLRPSSALQQMLAIGFTPHAMLWRPETASQMKWMPEESWRTFQRQWVRLGIIHAREVVPYAKSPLARAPVRAARSAQKDDAADLRNLRPAHRPTKAETVYNGDRVVNTSGRPVGNSRAYALRRLRDQRPDIHARVLAGEISPHAGTVEAGFRKRQQHPRAGDLKRFAAAIPDAPIRC
jgi:hypothetical protein